MRRTREKLIHYQSRPPPPPCDSTLGARGEGDEGWWTVRFSVYFLFPFILGFFIQTLYIRDFFFLIFSIFIICRYIKYTHVYTNIYM